MERTTGLKTCGQVLVPSVEKTGEEKKSRGGGNLKKRRRTPEKKGKKMKEKVQHRSCLKNRQQPKR